MCIKIPVSSLTSFSFIVELVVYFSEKGKRILFPSLLFTSKCDRYDSKESRTTLHPFDVKI